MFGVIYMLWLGATEVAPTSDRVETSSDVGSEEVSNGCAYWAQTGECEKNPRYMHAKCGAYCKIENASQEKRASTVAAPTEKKSSVPAPQAKTQEVVNKDPSVENSAQMSEVRSKETKWEERFAEMQPFSTTPQVREGDMQHEDPEAETKTVSSDPSTEKASPEHLVTHDRSFGEKIIKEEPRVYAEERDRKEPLAKNDSISGNPSHDENTTQQAPQALVEETDIKDSLAKKDAVSGNPLHKENMSEEAPQVLTEETDIEDLSIQKDVLSYDQSYDQNTTKEAPQDVVEETDMKDSLAEKDANSGEPSREENLTEEAPQVLEETDMEDPSVQKDVVSGDPSRNKNIAQQAPQVSVEETDIKDSFAKKDALSGDPLQKEYMSEEAPQLFAEETDMEDPSGQKDVLSDDQPYDENTTEEAPQDVAEETDMKDSLAEKDANSGDPSREENLTEEASQVLAEELDIEDPSGQKDVVSGHQSHDENTTKEVPEYRPGESKYDAVTRVLASLEQKRPLKKLQKKEKAPPPVFGKDHEVSNNQSHKENMSKDVPQVPANNTRAEHQSAEKETVRSDQLNKGRMTEEVPRVSPENTDRKDPSAEKDMIGSHALNEGNIAEEVPQVSPENIDRKDPSVEKKTSMDGAGAPAKKAHPEHASFTKDSSTVIPELPAEGAVGENAFARIVRFDPDHLKRGTFGVIEVIQILWSWSFSQGSEIVAVLTEFLSDRPPLAFICIFQMLFIVTILTKRSFLSAPEKNKLSVTPRTPTAPAPSAGPDINALLPYFGRLEQIQFQLAESFQKQGEQFMQRFDGIENELRGLQNHRAQIDGELIHALREVLDWLSGTKATCSPGDNETDTSRDGYETGGSSVSPLADKTLEMKKIDDKPLTRFGHPGLPGGPVRPPGGPVMHPGRPVVPPCGTVCSADVQATIKLVEEKKLSANNPKLREPVANMDPFPPGTPVKPPGVSVEDPSFPNSPDTLVSSQNKLLHEAGSAVADSPKAGEPLPNTDPCCPVTPPGGPVMPPDIGPAENKSMEKSDRNGDESKPGNTASNTDPLSARVGFGRPPGSSVRLPTRPGMPPGGSVKPPGVPVIPPSIDQVPNQPIEESDHNGNNTQPSNAASNSNPFSARVGFGRPPGSSVRPPVRPGMPPGVPVKPPGDPVMLPSIDPVPNQPAEESYRNSDNPQPSNAASNSSPFAARAGFGRLPGSSVRPPGRPGRPLSCPVKPPGVPVMPPDIGPATDKSREENTCNGDNPQASAAPPNSDPFAARVMVPPKRSPTSRPSFGGHTRPPQPSGGIAASSNPFGRPVQKEIKSTSNPFSQSIGR